MADLARLEELLARIEAATDFDRDLDLSIGIMLDGWVRRVSVGQDLLIVSSGDGYMWPPSAGQEWPSFTESIEEALALVDRVLPDQCISLQRVNGWKAALAPTPTASHYEGEALSAPLALLAALLKAKLQQLSASSTEGL